MYKIGDVIRVKTPMRQLVSLESVQSARIVGVDSYGPIFERPSYQIETIELKTQELVDRYNASIAD